MSLAAELLQAYDRPTSWGDRDCVQFAAAAVRFYGGWRPAVPGYSNQREALRIIAAAEGGLAELVTRAMGQMVHPAQAELGDTVLTAFRDTGQMLGVADPPGFWVLVERGGFLPLTLEYAIGVWPCRQSRFSSME